jgi:hypothetical protein
MLVFTGIWFILAIPAMAQDNPAKSSTNSVNRSRQETAPSDEELAKERQNPIADLIQIPIVSNLDFGAAAGNGFQYTLTFQPVIPVRISHDWNLITRPIFSVVSAPQSTTGLGRTAGSSDLITQFYWRAEVWATHYFSNSKSS